MSRGGRNKDRSEAERKCIATGEVKPTADLIRFVVDPEGTIVHDVLGKLPGRGIWVTSTTKSLEMARTKDLFSKAARAKVATPDDLVARVEKALTQRVINLISLTRKSGRAVCGYEKVKGWLMTEEARVLVQASDGSARGKGKLSTPHDGGKFIGIMTGQELGLAFGRENVIHCALAGGGLSKLVVEEAGRLKGLRDADGGKPAKKDTKSR